MDCPKKLNIGSGKDFKEDFLNLDIDPSWSPDIVLDISKPLPEEVSFDTERFGKIEIVKNSFEMIIAYDVLEHIPNLSDAVKNCLDLLNMDGILEFFVPYDLSYGAWQDPGHVRAFNERSWLYFTDWFWYLGWKEARFKLEKLDYYFSDLGKELRKKDISVSEIACTPRAVDSLFGVLKKIPLTEEDVKNLEKFRPA
ncbi:hypothetical protein ACFL4T_07565 [candidate division KSB1 bacterium]